MEAWKEGLRNGKERMMKGEFREWKKLERRELLMLYGRGVRMKE